LLLPSQIVDDDYKDVVGLVGDEVEEEHSVADNSSTNSNEPIIIINTNSSSNNNIKNTDKASIDVSTTKALTTTTIVTKKTTKAITIGTSTTSTTSTTTTSSNTSKALVMKKPTTPRIATLNVPVKFIIENFDPMNMMRQPKRKVSSFFFFLLKMKLKMKTKTKVKLIVYCSSLRRIVRVCIVNGRMLVATTTDLAASVLRGESDTFVKIESPREPKQRRLSIHTSSSSTSLVTVTIITILKHF